MDKKYELIKDEDGLIRIRALKDFILITGETVKKGDIGGCVVSEKCLSQEGNCWIMDDAYVEGQVSGNAVIKDFAIVNGRVSGNAVVKDCGYVSGNVSGNAIVKDFAKIYGKVSENAVIKDYVEVYGSVSGNAIVEDCGYVYGTVSGNAIVKDFTFVGENATVTGNAIVQAWQRINYGTVTTDLLGTKDWTDALYAEFGIVPKDGKVTLYKAVWSTDNPTVFKSIYNDDFLYEIGKEAIETDVDENVMNECGKGLHFTTLERTKHHNGNMIIKCEIDIEDIITVQFAMVRTRKCRVISVLWS